MTDSVIFYEIEGEGEIEINKTGPAKKTYSVTEKGSIELEKLVEFIRQRENIFKIFLDRFSNLKNQKEDEVK